jgi:hypothetical protein
VRGHPLNVRLDDDAPRVTTSWQRAHLAQRRGTPAMAAEYQPCDAGGGARKPRAPAHLRPQAGPIFFDCARPLPGQRAAGIVVTVGHDGTSGSRGLTRMSGNRSLN